MGWNTGYTIFEETVIGAYDLGKLDKPLLSVLMEPYRGSDIDSGGSQDLTSKDGLSVEEVVIKVWGGRTFFGYFFPVAWPDCLHSGCLTRDPSAAM